MRAPPARRVARAADLGQGIVPAPDFLGRPSGPGEPEALMAPPVVAEVVTGIHDAPHEVSVARRALSDQEERARHPAGRQKIEHTWRGLGIRTVVEAERDPLSLARSAP